MKHKSLKQILSLLLAMVMLIGLLPMATIPAFAAEDSENEIGEVLDGDVVEVSSWSEFEAAFASSDYSGKSYTIKLMNDLHYDAADVLRSATAIVEVDVNGCFVTLDFNGYTLSCTDDVSSSDFESVLSDFIRINLHPINQKTPIEFILTDSAGGGGVSMDSSRAYDNQLAALRVYDTRRFVVYGYFSQTDRSCKLTINGGNYTLNAKSEYFGKGTLTGGYDYRGTVIADDLKAVEINGGIFTANGEGWTSDYVNKDMCARELSAFATCTTGSKTTKEDMTGQTVINGGTFISNGYAIHHFDISKTLGDAEQKLFPMINGGVFSGGIAYIGKTFTYSDGYEEYENKKATDIINNDAYVICIKDGEKYGLEDDLDLRDLHDATSLYVFSGSLFDFETAPEGEGDPTMLTRSVKQSDTFEVSWTVPESLTSAVVCQPTITITRPNSTIEPKTYSKSKVTVDYSEYPNDVIVSCRLYVLVGGESVYFEQNYEVDVNRIYTATDSCIHCYAAGEDGWDEVVEGSSCSFKIYPKDYYELTDPDKLEVYVNGVLVTPDEDGVYTVENVTEDLDIYCDGSAFTSYSNLTVTANGKTVTEKILDGGTYTFKNLAEFGATVPENSTFTGWKIGNKTYQPGETYTVPGGTEIAVNAAFTGLHNITVENGKAYADEAHTIPISAAAEDQVIYIVADSAPEGKVFSYWSHQIATAGGGGSFGNYDAAQTTYKVYYSDVVLTPVYETQIDNIVINGMKKPSAGVAIDNSDYSYKWGCSVPTNSGYSLGICYWYDITDGEPELAMSDGDVFQIGHTYRFKAKINLYGDTVLAAKEDISVALTGLDADSYTWTISEYSQIYENMVIYFEFTCEREEPDTSIKRPEGSGTAGDPFKISTVGELYWFTGFTNNYVAVGEDFAVERNKANAILMNDITVNPELLTEDGALNGTSGFAHWTPIGYYSDYSGTFDGQGYSISGLYYNTKGYQHEYYGFIARMGENGAVKDLTLKDTYFYTEFTGNGTPYAAGIVAFAPEASNRIENCHFDGVVGAESSNRGSVVGGITALTGGKIQDCTAKGRVLGADSYSGSGKAGGIAGTTYDTAMISDCTNYAEVTCWDSGTGVGYAGGIAGYLAGTVKDCCNQGVINGYNQGNYNYVGGIVGWASGSAEQRNVISRCFNEASFAGSGIVDYIYSSGTYYEGYVTVKNCYNTGSVTNGIVGTAKGVGISITYCHNVGITTKPIIDSIINADDIEMENCYYVETSHYDTDRVEMTEAMLAEEFADGTVLALLDNGHWTQGEDDEYPVLGDAPGATVSGNVTSFGSDTDDITVELYAEGSASADYTVTVKGNTAEYSIEGVAAGIYTMKVSKKNHVTRTYTVTVGSEAVVKDAKIHLKGDIDGNGKVNVGDTTKVYSHVKKTALITDEYMLLCADVSGDGRINVGDTTKVYAHVKKTSLLW